MTLMKVQFSQQIFQKRTFHENLSNLMQVRVAFHNFTDEHNYRVHFDETC